MASVEVIVPGFVTQERYMGYIIRVVRSGGYQGAARWVNRFTRVVIMDHAGTVVRRCLSRKFARTWIKEHGYA
jgi:hypothetical protein